MKKLTTFLFVALFLMTFSTGWSQLGIELGVNGGATIPTGDYSGTMEHFYAGSKYGLTTGFNIGGYGNLTTPIISGRVSLNYSSVSNDGSPGTGFGGGTIELKHNLFTIGIGPQYSIPIPQSPIKPFLIAELLIASISGEVSFQGISSIPSKTYDIPTVTRIGLGLTGGLNYDIGSYGFDLSLKYCILNLSGKEFTSFSDNARVNSYINLNDDKDPLYGTDPNVHVVSNDRDVSTFQINLGFHFTLGM